ncbi:MAG: Sulfatase-modifying factor enzyme 1, partial [Chloroflexota bacterium]
MTRHDLVVVPAGTFRMGTGARGVSHSGGREWSGTGFEADGEGPARDVTVASFAIARTAVTNAQFR